MSKTQLLKKMSPKTILGEVKKYIFDKETGEIHKDGTKFTLAKIFGKAHGVKTGQSDHGEWVAFLGAFGAIVTDEKGEIINEYRSPKVFLPEPMQTMLAAALHEADTVEFAVELGIECDSTSATGYTYTVNPIVEVKESDALAHLRDQSMGKLTAPPTKKAS